MIVWERSAVSFLRFNVPDSRSVPTLHKISYDCYGHKTFFGFERLAEYLVFFQKIVRRGFIAAPFFETLL